MSGKDASREGLCGQTSKSATGTESPAMKAFVDHASIRRLYICGPMSGLPDFNYPAFNAEARRLRGMGYQVENPAENPEQTGWDAYMRVSVRQMLTCDAVVILPGWGRSRGATIERSLAIDLGMPVLEPREVWMCEPSGEDYDPARIDPEVGGK